MSKIAFVFPGQASQYVGMGKSLSDTFPEAQSVFQEADEKLGFSISNLCFNGPESELNLTTNTQPAVLTTSIAIYRVISNRYGIKPDFVAGHSLGEYSALVAAEVLSLADAVMAVHKRGQYMQEAVAVGVGAMAAVLKADLQTIETVCRDAAQGQVCTPANINSPKQTVIAGHKEAVERAISLLKTYGAKAILLPVSAPFHCELMKSAEKYVAEDLERLVFNDPKFPIVANVTAQVVRTGIEAKQNLIKQVCAPVRWAESVNTFVKAGVTTFVEVGPKTVLSGLISQNSSTSTVLNADTPETLENVAKSLSMKYVV